MNRGEQWYSKGWTIFSKWAKGTGSGNGTVTGVGRVVDERAKGQRSTLREFWKRKDPPGRRVSALDAYVTYCS